MSTRVPDDSQAPKREPPSLYLRINGAYYRVERVKLPDVFEIGWRLIHFEDKKGHGPYLISKGKSGAVSCECGAWVMRGEPQNRLCKHLLAVESVGLI